MVAALDVGVIHGPPGTGKTTTLIQVIKQLSRGERTILVCAPSNTAVDLLTIKLQDQGINAVRVGNLARIDDEVFPITLEHAVTGSKDYTLIKKLKKQAQEYREVALKYKRNFGQTERNQRRELLKEAKVIKKQAFELEDQLVEQTLDHAQVITTTLVGTQSKYIRDMRFNTCVIDEAGQALEGATWIPILKANKVILAGDPLQLPPTVKSRQAKPVLSQTLLEKAIHNLKRISFLDTQYRMNDTIVQFSNLLFYDSKLKTPEYLRSQEDCLVEFIDTAGCGFDEESHKETKSLHNPGELDIISKHIDSSLEEYIAKGFSIGIISPYKEQMLALEDSFNDYLLHKVPFKISTIDGFQGQERDVIYISFVRSNDQNEIGFLKDYRRLNVAISRAKKRMILIGDSSTLSTDKIYNALIESFQSKGLYKSAWEYLA
jgi:superfamily I DNA and/or RNA helicase